MRHYIILAASTITLLAFGPTGWSQFVPEMNPKLAPTIDPKHATSSESLLAEAQDLTKKISQAKAQGRDTSVAAEEQTLGERSMQEGKDQEALRHFQAGERAWGNRPSPLRISAFWLAPTSQADARKAFL